MKHIRTSAGVRPGRRAALGVAVVGVVAVLGLGGLGVASAATTGPDATSAPAAKEEPGKPPVVIEPGEPQKTEPLPEGEQPTRPAAPEPGPRPKPLPGVEAPANAKVATVVATAAPSLQPEKSPTKEPGKLFYRASDASVQIGVAAGGTVEDEVRWALAEAAHSGVAGSTEVRKLAGGAQAVITVLSRGAQVSVFTPGGLRVTVAVIADDEAKDAGFTAGQALVLARAIAALG